MVSGSLVTPLPYFSYQVFGTMLSTGCSCANWPHSHAGQYSKISVLCSAMTESTDAILSLQRGNRSGYMGRFTYGRTSLSPTMEKFAAIEESTATTTLWDFDQRNGNCNISLCGSRSDCPDMPSPNAQPQRRRDRACIFSHPSESLEIKRQRVSHNAYERQRREQVNLLYQKLNSLLPPCHHPQKQKGSPNKPEIVGRALGYIPALEKQFSVLQRQRDEIRSIGRGTQLGVHVHFMGKQTMLTIHVPCWARRCIFAVVPFLEQQQNVVVISVSMSISGSSAWGTFHIQSGAMTDIQSKSMNFIMNKMKAYQDNANEDE